MQEKLKVGDHVWVLNDQAEVIRLQREHGEWNDDMAFVSQLKYSDQTRQKADFVLCLCLFY